MAAPRPIEVFNEDGTPRENASPTILLYIDRAGTARTPPSDGVVNRGDGFYRLTPSNDDETVGTIAVVDAGPLSFPRYTALAIYRSVTKFLVFLPLSIVDLSLSAGAPSVGAFTNLVTGDPVLPEPTVRKAGAHEVYSASPSSSDLELGVGLRLDAPPGIYPTTLFETFTNEVSASSSTDDGTVIYSSPPAAPAAVGVLAPELCDAVDLLASGSYLVTRPSPVTIVEGVVVPGAPGYFYAVGSMQATSGDDLKLLPEGHRTRETKTFFTCQRLRGLNSTPKPDQITVDGVLFEVSFVQDWQQLGAYHRVILTKVSS